MAEVRRTISAGSHEVYEVIQHDNGDITIRVIEHPEESVRLLSGLRTTLIRILDEMRG